MRFRRRSTPDVEEHVEEQPAAESPAAEPEPAPAQPAETLELTHPELERLVAQHADANPARAVDWRWYADYLRDRVAADGRISAEYRLLLRIVYADLPGLPERLPDQTATAESTASRSDET
jgi:hypothetical protein